MKINREWEMPNSNTFSIKAIGRFIANYCKGGGQVVIDPFANKNRIGTITNDIDPEMKCDYCLDALDFLKLQAGNCCDVLLFDPPYSPRQVAEVYKKLELTVNMETTQSSFWGNMKKEISRIIKPGGYCLSFGWNSGGIGIKHGFDIEEILLVAHGGWHNDTICTAERKITINLF